MTLLGTCPSTFNFNIQLGLRIALLSSDLLGNYYWDHPEPDNFSNVILN